MTIPLEQRRIAWAPWSADAFARAARERKPVLLSITAAWCEACHEMDRTTYADDRVIALVRDRFVAVRVDADRRPDINERYNLGGWPTTAFLTADGALLGGGTFVSADRLPGVLEQVADAAGTPPAIVLPPESIPAPRAGDEPTLDAVIAAVFETYDE